jgi:hypothetical protein
MNHLQEETLIAHFYGEAEDSTGVASHLAACGECAEAFAALKSDLAEMKQMEALGLDPSGQDAAYGERVWSAIAPSLTAYRPAKKRWLGIGFSRGLSYAAACALLLSAAFYSGRLWEQRQSGATAAHTTLPTALPAKPHVVVVVLSDHLDRSERLLVELKHADASSDETLAPMRDEARTLLAANRICQKNSASKDDPQLAVALDRLNTLLGELASQPDGLNAANLARLQAEMSTEGLLFEVRVLRSRVENHAAAKVPQSMGGTI